MCVLCLYSLHSLQLEKRRQEQDLLLPGAGWGIRNCPSLLFWPPSPLTDLPPPNWWRKGEHWDDPLLRVFRACTFIHCWMLWPCPWSRKIWDWVMHLMGKKKKTTEYTSGYYPWLHVRIHLVRFLKWSWPSHVSYISSQCLWWQGRENPSNSSFVCLFVLNLRSI